MVDINAHFGYGFALVSQMPMSNEATIGLLHNDVYINMLYSMVVCSGGFFTLYLILDLLDFLTETAGWWTYELFPYGSRGGYPMAMYDLKYLFIMISTFLIFLYGLLNLLRWWLGPGCLHSNSDPCGDTCSRSARQPIFVRPAWSLAEIIFSLVERLGWSSSCESPACCPPKPSFSAAACGYIQCGHYWKRLGSGVVTICCKPNSCTCWITMKGDGGIVLINHELICNMPLFREKSDGSHFTRWSALDMASLQPICQTFCIRWDNIVTAENFNCAFLRATRMNCDDMIAMRGSDCAPDPCANTCARPCLPDCGDAQQCLALPPAIPRLNTGGGNQPAPAPMFSQPPIAGQSDSRQSTPPARQPHAGKVPPARSTIPSTKTSVIMDHSKKKPGAHRPPHKGHSKPKHGGHPNRHGSSMGVRHGASRHSRAPSRMPSHKPSRLARSHSHTPSRQLSRLGHQPSRSTSQHPVRHQPSRQPSQLTRQPSRAPSRQMSRAPSKQMSRAPSRQMSRAPSRQMSRAPSKQMSRAPSRQMSRAPSRQMSRAPSSMR